MIIDVHVHHRWTEPENPPWAQIEETVATAVHSGITKIGLLGTGSAHGVDPAPHEIRNCNSHGAAIVARYPDRVFSLCYLNPAHSVTFIRDEVKRCVEEHGVPGIKLWIAVNAGDARMSTVMEEAVRYNLPVFFHAWYKSVGWVYNESSPADIRKLALRYPQATVVMLHMPGGRERGVLDVKDLPNVYVDTSGSQPDCGFVEYAVCHLGAERILYGSDAPGRDYAPQLAKVTGAFISDRAKHQILAENAATLLKL